MAEDKSQFLLREERIFHKKSPITCQWLITTSHGHLSINYWEKKNYSFTCRLRSTEAIGSRECVKMITDYHSSTDLRWILIIVHCHAGAQFDLHRFWWWKTEAKNDHLGLKWKLRDIKVSGECNKSFYS